MADHLFDPIPIAYRGLSADAHLVDAQQFGKSLLGASKVANSVCHTLLFGEVGADPKKYQVRFYVGPSKENGLVQEIVALMNSGFLPMFQPVLTKVGKSFIEKTIDAMVKTVLGRKSESDVAVEKLYSLASQHTEFSTQVHAGQMRDKAWLQDMVSGLVFENRTALRELPEPVGKSVRQMQLGSPNDVSTIDEPAAEVLRARDALMVGDSAEFSVTVEGVFKTNGACRLKIQDTAEVVSGKITDPALGTSGNVYTRALHEGLTLRVRAKPTLKGDHIHTLFVSDATLAG